MFECADPGGAPVWGVPDVIGQNRTWAALVPELTCSDLPSSMHFYTNVVGFAVGYLRPGFAYLDLGNAQLMLEQGPSDWTTGMLEPPFGRGINLQIEIDDVDGLANRLRASSVPIFIDVAENWYRANGLEHGQRELLVQDPDGYLLRFVTVLGERPVESGTQL